MKLIYDGGWRVYEGERYTLPYITPRAAQNAAERGDWCEPIPDGWHLIAAPMGRPTVAACKRCGARVCRAEAVDGFVLAEWDARRRINACDYAPAHTCQRSPK